MSYGNPPWKCLTDVQISRKMWYCGEKFASQIGHIFLTLNAYELSWLFEVYGSIMRGHSLEASYFLRYEFKKCRGSDVQASWCLMAQSSKRKDGASKKHSLVVRSFDHDIPSSTVECWQPLYIELKH